MKSRLYNYFVITSEICGRVDKIWIARCPIGCSWLDEGARVQYYAGIVRHGEGTERWDARHDRAVIFKTEKFAHVTMRCLALMAERARYPLRRSR